MNNAMPGRPMRLAGREVKGAAQLRVAIEMDVQEASSREITRVHTRMPIDRSWGRERCIGFSRPR